MMRRLNVHFKCHVIGPEYPGYGMCFKQQKSSKEITKRARRLFDFLTNDFGYSQSDIIIFGRSLGSGPAIQVAMNTFPCLLILMSAYSQIKNVARDICCCAKCFIKERYNSLENIQKVKCPFFLVHGK